MGSIWAGDRIRERFPKSWRKPMHYKPTKERPLPECLAEHNRVIELLTSRQLALASNIWMRDLVNSLVIKNTEAEKDTCLKEYLGLLDKDVYKITNSETEGITSWFRPTRSSNIESISLDYLKFYSKTKVHTYPLAGTNDDFTLRIIQHVIENESMAEKWSHGPAGIIVEYCSGLSIKSAAIVKKNLKLLMGFMSSRKIWMQFFSAEKPGLSDIRDVTLTDLMEFKYWRSKTRFRNIGGKDRVISDKSIKRDYAFIKAVLRYAQAERIITNDPSLPIKINKDPLFVEGEKQVLPETGNRPIEFKALKKMVYALSDYYHGLPVNQDPERRRESRLNCLTVIFLLATGCRPKEVNEWRIEDDQLAIYGDKNYSSRRNQDITPTIRTVISDSQFKENQECSRVAGRVTEFLKTKFNKTLTSYRIRHTFSVLNLVSGEVPLPHLSRSLGHAETSTTEIHYGKLRGFLRIGSPKEASNFIRWFHYDLFNEINFNHPDFFQEEKIDEPIKDGALQIINDDGIEEFIYLRKRESEGEITQSGA